MIAQAPIVSAPAPSPRTPIASTSAATSLIVQRNRRNAQRGTGPRTAAGKAKSSRNSLTHGLTANPAVGLVENRKRFEELLVALSDELQPRGVLEEAAIHQIAVSIWRLQRSARADAASASLAIDTLAPLRHRVQDWIVRIQPFWRADIVEGTDPQALEARARKNGLREDGSWLRAKRLNLPMLDELLNTSIMADPAGLQAMSLMLQDHRDRLAHDPQMFSAYDAEQMAWLMGECARRLPVNDDEVKFISQYPPSTALDRLIGDGAIPTGGHSVADCTRAID